MPSFWNLFNRTEELKQVDATVPLTGGYGQTEDPPDNYQNFAREGYGKNAIVYACIRELSTAAASVRYLIQKPTADGGYVEDESGEFARLLSRPNDLQDWYTFIEKLVTYLNIAGNVYVLKQRDGVGRVRDLYLLPPDRVSVAPRGDGRNDYVYEIDSKEYKIPYEDIGHLKLPNPEDDNFGLSPLHVISKIVNLDMSITDFNKAYFNNAGVPSGLLKLKKRLTSQEEANIIRNRWRSSFGGTNNLHSVAILDEDASYEQMASAPKDMAMTEVRNTTETRICAVLGVPPILISANVGLQRSTYSNYREARFAFFAETVNPLITRIVRFFNFMLEPDFPNDGEFAVDMSEYRAYLDEDDSITNRASELFVSGIVSLNEAREMVGIEAVNNGDIRRIPTTTTEVIVGELPIAPMNPIIAAQPLEELKGIPAVGAVADRAKRMSRRLIVERESLTDKWTPEYQKYFRSLQNRVDGILGRLMERGQGIEVIKAMPQDYAELIPEESAQQLSGILFRQYSDGIETTFATVNDAGVAGTVTYDATSPLVTGLLTGVPERTTLIHSTTLRATQRVIDIALSRGYTIEQLARGVPDENFVGIRSVFTEATNVRAKLIARTETMRTQNLTTTRIYQDQGFGYARADDPDGDPNDDYVDPADPYGFTCAERHNTIYPLIDAQNIMDHPNGRLNWLPMPRDYKPEGVLV
jgi:HK97 family phage portal protein